MSILGPQPSSDSANGDVYRVASANISFGAFKTFHAPHKVSIYSGKELAIATFDGQVTIDWPGIREAAARATTSKSLGDFLALIVWEAGNKGVKP